MYPAPRVVRFGGRHLTVEDPGPESGFPVVVFNGAGSRHLFLPAVTEAGDLGFRLIGYDRPGCGGSTAVPGRSVADCAADVQAIMTGLGIARIAVWGSSGGGPYALAAAALLPEAVAAVCLFASVGPYGVPDLDFAQGLGGDEFREQIRRKLDEPARARADFRARSAVTLAQRGSPAWWLEHWGERAGQDTAHSRDQAEHLATCHRDVLRADDSGAFDDDGAWDDDLAIYQPWGFSLADIQAPVSMWHGQRDFLPLTHARWLADRIPKVTTHYPAGNDHATIEENNRAAALDWLTAQTRGGTASHPVTAEDDAERMP